MKTIIIGAGAAGLMAAKELAAAGHHVQVLEARDRIGGRICTFSHNGNRGLEGGAEFIHGNLSVTLQLLEEAGLAYNEVGGKMLSNFQGEWGEGGEPFEHAELVAEKLRQADRQMSMQSFIDGVFSGDEFIGLRHALTGYIEGYYAADPARMSANKFYQEWQAEDEQQYRPGDGYGAMISYLADKLVKSGGSIETAAIAKMIEWKNNHVIVRCANGKIYDADKLIITIPLGVWQNDNSIASLSFRPSLPEKFAAAHQLGFGKAIKILLWFDEAFWDTLSVENIYINNMGFIFSDQQVPTYWTQQPNKKPLLTGWLAGPKAADKKWENDDVVKTEALKSLSIIWKLDLEELQEKLVWSKIFNWNKEPFSLGAYTYSTIGCDDAKQQLGAPVGNTLFFAGEALYTGTETGTVEAALTSGMVAAKQLLSSFSSTK